MRISLHQRRDSVPGRFTGLYRPLRTAAAGLCLVSFSALSACSAYHATVDTVGGWFGASPSKPSEPPPDDTPPAPQQPQDAVIPATLPQDLVGPATHPAYVAGSRHQPVEQDNVNDLATAAPAAPETPIQSPEALACIAAAKGKPLASVPVAVGANTVTAADVQKAAGLLKGHAGTHIEVIGHASDQGNDNQTASDKRAEAVAAALRAGGYATAALCAAGVADTRPLFAETTDQDKIANQRVDVYLTP